MCAHKFGSLGREPGRRPRGAARMVLTTTGRTVLMVAVVVLSTGCGSSNRTNHADNGLRSGVGDNLLGTYTTTLKPSDLHEIDRAEVCACSPELHQSSLTWKLEISNSGGTNGGSAFTIKNSRGVLESSSFSVEATKILLRQEECTAGDREHLYNNEYGYRLAGRTLTFTTIRNRCRDRVAQTVLTSERWEKGSG